ncbi:unnamed protein product [Mortierella alpina]
MLPPSRRKHLANLRQGTFAALTQEASCQPHAGNMLPPSRRKRLANLTQETSCHPHAGNVLPQLPMINGLPTKVLLVAKGKDIGNRIMLSLHLLDSFLRIR